MDNTDDLELILNIIKTKQELQVANLNFQVAETGLIDYYSYQIKANKVKLDYLIRQVKKRGITLDTFQKLKISLCENEAM